MRTVGMRYFAYGSNMDPAQMAERQVRYAAARRAVLGGYRLDFTRCSDRWHGAGVADIVRAADGTVEGVVYDVDEAGLATLDGYEGVHGGTYRRVAVTVTTEEGVSCQAVAYEVVTKGSFVAPHPEYLARLVRGAKAFGLSAAYLRTLRSLPVAS